MNEFSMTSRWISTKASTADIAAHSWRRPLDFNAHTDFDDSTRRSG